MAATTAKTSYKPIVLDPKAKDLLETALNQDANIREDIRDGRLDSSDFENASPTLDEFERSKYCCDPAYSLRSPALAECKPICQKLDHYTALRRLTYQLGRFTNAGEKEDTVFEEGIKKYIQWRKEGPQTPFRSPYPNFPYLNEVLAWNKFRHMIISARTLVMVTHPMRGYDPREAAREGIEKEVESAKNRHNPVIYLMNGVTPFFHFYLHDMQPDAYVNSVDGSHDIQFEGREAILGGGYLAPGACLPKTVASLIRHRTSQEELTIKIPTDAVFISTDMTLKELFAKGTSASYMENFFKTFFQNNEEQLTGIDASITMKYKQFTYSFKLGTGRDHNIILKFI
ncbi:MAG: hypothetical protein Q7T11_07190 [Deltaproteobacteria bacterium]|nr:hypothetical protein [Deltaproteobacteria bacterium]